MYPTKEKILAKNPNIEQKFIEITKLWKHNYFRKWSSKSKIEKRNNIELLIWILAMAADAMKIKSSKKLQLAEGIEYAYNTKKQTIIFERGNPSIISALHELGHHLYGSSELKACRWSIWLFRTCFPKQYEKLNWEGHMLKK